MGSWQQAWQCLLESCLALIYPPRCPLCRAYVEQAGGWCPACLRAAVAPHRLPLSPASSLAEAWALGHYRGSLRELIGRLKYRRERSSLPYIKTFLAACAERADAGEIIRLAEGKLVVPVPLHQSRESERGFNQAELIFRDWLTEQGGDWQRLLVRTRATQPMYELDVRQRRENLRGAFALAGEAAQELVAGRQVLLVDDIMTTGATLTACAGVLLTAGAGKVQALVLASDRA